MSTSPEPTPKTNVYAVFCGPINEESVRDLLRNLSGVSVAKQAVHLLFQSSGGTVGDAVCLYNFFRTLPTEVSIYNVGSVCSAAVIAYLGAKRRVTSARGMFMIHRVMAKPGEVPAVVMPGIVRNLALNDERCESILKENVTLLGGKKWSDLDNYDFFFSGKEAVEVGLAHEIGEFAPPAGASVYHFLPQVIRNA